VDIEAQAVNTSREHSAGQAQEYIDKGWEKVEHQAKEKLLLLYTKGRKSGNIWRTPLIYHFPDETSLLLVANNGGRDQHPDWYLNIVADGTVWIRNRDDVYEADAVTLVGDERADVWARLVGSMPFFEESQSKMERTIPLIRVTRKAG
jgi:deazaflavin-dependent oxidoreductase (nitroreductase family)